MPTIFAGPPAFATASRAVATTPAQISSASCSTQPERGKCCVNSRCATAGHPRIRVEQQRPRRCCPLVDRQHVARHAASPVLNAALRSLLAAHRQMLRALVASPARQSHRRRSTHERPDAERTAESSSYLSALTVYLRPSVLVIMLLGFSSGLPLALSGETLRVWMADSGVDLGTIGLLVARRPALHAEIHLGACRRCLAGTGAVAPLRPPPRLAHRLAARADGGDRVPRHARPDQRPVDDRPWRAHRRLRLGDAGHRRRCLPRAERCRSTSRRRAWRATSPPIASACWRRAPASSASAPGWRRRA